MNIDGLSLEQIKALEAQKHMKKFRPSGVHPDRVSIENMDEEQIRGLEAQRNRYEPGSSGLHPDRVSIENMDEEQIRGLEAQRNRYEPGPSGLHPDRVGIENMDEDQIRGLEAQRNRYEVGPSRLHPDRVSVENMDEEQIRGLEAQRNRYEPGPSGLHPDRVGIENMDEDQLRSLEAQVFERKQTDIPFKRYFENLIASPVINDEKEFEEAVIRSMQSNSLIEVFINGILEKIDKKVFNFKYIEKNDTETITSSKKEIEDLVNVYERYLYTLKEQGWNFKSIGFDVNSMSVSEVTQNKLWRIQKDYDIVFNLSIPADLGEHYGKAFERDCKMIPGLSFMYDELRGKEVNWHQVMIYEKNELTPYQRYLQSKVKSEEESAIRM